MRSVDHISLKYHLTDKIAARFWKFVDKNPDARGCWNWTASLHGQGYGRFKLDSYVNVGSNRMAYALHHQQDPGPMFVLHECDNRKCCNPAHLFLGTHDDNMADMVAKGRHFAPPAAGEKNGNAKLTAEQVEMVKDLIRRKRNNTEIARAFGVTHQLISRIRRGKAWGTEAMQPKYASLKR